MEKAKVNNSFSLDVTKALSQGWQSLRANFLILFIVQLSLYFLESPFDRLTQWQPLFELSEDVGYFSVLDAAYTLFVYSAFYAGSHLVFLRGVKGEGVSFKTFFAGFSNYVAVVLATLLAIGLIGVSLIFFIVPGIFVMSRLVFVPYLVMDEGLGPIEAIEGSWRLSKGHVAKVIALFSVGIPFALIILLILILTGPYGSFSTFWVVAALPIEMWIKSSLAALYLSVTEQPQPILKQNAISVRGLLTLIFGLIAIALLLLLIFTFEIP